jgi:hypothetical protein
LRHATNCWRPTSGPMLFNDGTAYRQTYADTMGFRGEERIENLIHRQRRQPNAGIADGHRDLSILRWLQLYSELPCPVPVVHRLDAVDHEVHQNLLQLHAVSCDLRQSFHQLCADRHGISLSLAAQENGHLSNNIVYVDRLTQHSALILRGVKVFPSQIEEALLATEWCAGHFQIELTREGRMDEMTVIAEARREHWDGEGLERHAHKLIARINDTIGVSTRVTIQAPETIERSAGKARRVIDKRPKS